MRSYCQYHPLESAIWHNPRIDTFYCEKCVDGSESAGGHGVATSLVTGEELQYLGSANSAAPFWEVLPDIFAYPFHKNAAIFLGVLIVLGGAVMQVGGIVSLVVLLILLAVITKYGFLVIASTAVGKGEPPNASEAMNGGFDVLGKQLLVQLFFGGFVYVVGMVGSSFLDFIAFALVVFVLPASLMMFAVEEDVASAVNPADLMRLIGHIGWAYLLLYLFLFLLSGASMGVIALFSGEVSENILLTLFMASTLYFLMVAYRLMGYVIFQYQGELGFVSEDQKTKERRRKNLNIVDAKVGVFIKEGCYEKALKLLHKETKLRPNSVQTHENLSRLLKAMGDKERYQEHGNVYMKMVYGFGDESRLYFLYCQYHDEDPHFIPDAPEVRHCLAEQLYQRGKFKESLALLANLHKDSPNYLEVPHAYLLMAKVLFEGMSNPKKALQFLGFIKKNYPQYPNKEAIVELAAACKQAMG